MNENLGAKICEHVEITLNKSAPTQAVADWLMASYWLLGGDDGNAILTKRNVWLIGDCERLVKIALQMNEFYVGRDQQEERQVFDTIRRKHPSLNPLIAAISREI